MPLWTRASNSVIPASTSETIFSIEHDGEHALATPEQIEQLFAGVGQHGLVVGDDQAGAGNVGA